jgi:hypothetical protein
MQQHSMKLLEVGNNTKLQKEFLMLPVRLYKENPYWIRPLDADIEKVFDQSKNKLFKDDNCVRWVLQNADNQVVGRVAAFINYETANADNEQPTGGMGFFECINDEKAATILFDACKNWLTEKGIEAMDGPINFGDRNSWWGLLVDGFDKEPIYTMDYHLPYYRDLFENYGFQTYFKQFTFGRYVSDEKTNMHPLIKRAAKRIFEDQDYSFRHINKREIERNAEDFRTIYNKAWVNHAGVKEMSKEQAVNIFRTMKFVAEEDLIWYGYYKNEPVAFFVALPELNQLFKYVNGKLDLLGKAKFLYHKIMKTNKKMYGVVFGVVPEHQGRGVESAVMIACTKTIWQPNFRYIDAEFNWIGDFNPKMIKVCEMIDAKITKTHITYRYLFDRTKEFKRYPIIN